MTNYEILKEYEAHKELIPSYDELQNMNKAVNQAMAANIKLVEKLKIAVDTLSEIAELECSGSYMAYATIEKIKELDND